MLKEVPRPSLDEEDGDRDEREDEHVERMSLLSADDVGVGELVAATYFQHTAVFEILKVEICDHDGKSENKLIYTAGFILSFAMFRYFFCVSCEGLLGQ